MDKMTSTLQYQNLEALLDALAVLGEADPEILGLLLEQRLDAPALAHLIASPGVTMQERTFVMSSDAASVRLKALEGRDFLHFRLLHQRAATILAQRLGAGEIASESALMTVFTRLAEHLRHQDATKLPALLDAVRNAPLQNPQNQYYRTYMQGISLQQTGQYDSVADTVQFPACFR